MSGFGSFARGLSSGYMTGAKLDDMKQRRGQPNAASESRGVPDPSMVRGVTEVVSPGLVSGDGAQGFDPSTFSPEFVSGLRETADALQIPVEDVATFVSFETGGTFDPTQKGPTTQWGQHEGLIQFGKPQAKKYGVDFTDAKTAAATQLGKDGAIVRYALDHGFKPGEHGALDLYSTINAGAPGRYSASDANNGGAPGNVKDKFYTQMAGHREKARALLAHWKAPEPTPQERGVEGLISKGERLLDRFYRSKGAE